MSLCGITLVLSWPGMRRIGAEIFTTSSIVPGAKGVSHSACPQMSLRVTVLTTTFQGLRTWHLERATSPQIYVCSGGSEALMGSDGKIQR